MAATPESILFEINSSNYTAGIVTMYKPQPGNGGFVTTLRLTINLNSIEPANFPYIPDDTPPDVLQQILNDVALNTEYKEIILYRKKGNGAWIERAPIRIFNKEPYYDVNLMGYFSDANTIDVAEDLSLGIQIKTGNILAPGDLISVWGSAVEEKKNDPTLEAFGDRISALENLLHLFGAATPAVDGTNGLVAGAAAGQGDYLLRGDRTWQNPSVFVTPAQVNDLLLGLRAGAPQLLDTIDELAQAINDDPNFASTMLTQLSLKAPLASPVFSGFLTLSDIPLSVKRIDSTTAATQGGYVQIQHGLNSSKIQSINIMVNWSGNAWIPNNYTFNAGRQYTWDIPDASSISIINVSGNSNSILSKPVRIFIVYTS